MKPLIYLSLLLLTACKNQIDIDNIELREHGLTYIKGTNKLVDGQVIRKFKSGKTAELYNYEQGRAIGNYYTFGYAGETIAYGFGVNAKKYEAKLPNLDLTYSLLSICAEGSYAYATLYLDNPEYFDDPKILLALAKVVFADYYSKHGINDILIFDKEHECTIIKSATNDALYKIDTVTASGIKKKIIIR